MFKKFLLPILLSGFIAGGAYATMGTKLDSVTVGTYLYPKTTGETLGSSSLRWSVYSSALNTNLSTGFAYIDSSGIVQRLAYGATTKYYRGDGSLQTLDTSVVPENGNLFYTDARVRAAISGTAPISFNSSTGVFTCVVANGSVAGCVSTSDYNSWTAKQAAGITGDIAVSGTTATIQTNVVTNAQAAQMAANTIKGNNTGSLANAVDMTVSQLKTLLALAFTDITGIATVAQTTIANVALTTCSTARTVDWSAGNQFTLLLTNANTCALTFSNATSGQSITIDLAQPASTGSAVVSYVTTVLWAAGTAPTMTTGASKTDSCTYKYNGTDYRGSCVQDMR